MFIHLGLSLYHDRKTEAKLSNCLTELRRRVQGSGTVQYTSYTHPSYRDRRGRRWVLNELGVGGGEGGVRAGVRRASQIQSAR
jgi:hypothetical protein